MFAPAFHSTMKRPSAAGGAIEYLGEATATWRGNTTDPVPVDLTGLNLQPGDLVMAYMFSGSQSNGQRCEGGGTSFYWRHNASIASPGSRYILMRMVHKFMGETPDTVFEARVHAVVTSSSVGCIVRAYRGVDDYDMHDSTFFTRPDTVQTGQVLTPAPITPKTEGSLVVVFYGVGASGNEADANLSAPDLLDQTELLSNEDGGFYTGAALVGHLPTTGLGEVQPQAISNSMAANSNTHQQSFTILLKPKDEARVPASDPVIFTRYTGDFVEGRVIQHAEVPVLTSSHDLSGTSSTIMAYSSQFFREKNTIYGVPGNADATSNSWMVEQGTTGRQSMLNRMGESNSLNREYLNMGLLNVPGTLEIILRDQQGTETQEVSHSLGVKPRAIIASNLPNTATGGKWQWWHEDMYEDQFPGGYKFWHQSDRNSSNLAYWGTVTDTTFEFGSAALSRQNMLYLLFADSDICKVGHYIGDGTTNRKIELPWRPKILWQTQFDGSNGFRCFAKPLGWTVGATSSTVLLNNTVGGINQNLSNITCLEDGFNLNASNRATNSAGFTYVYIAIRDQGDDDTIVEAVTAPENPDPQNPSEIVPDH